MATFLKKLGITLPIIQAPMAGVSTPAMAAAVSNAGALGSLGIGSSNVDQARKLIMDTRALTDKPFGVNVFCHQPAKPDPAKEAQWLAYLAPHFARYGANPPAEIHAPYPSFLENSDMVELLLELRPRVVSFHFGLPPDDTLDKLKSTGASLLATATNLIEAKAIAQAGLDAVIAQGYEAGGHRGCFEPDAPDQCLSMPDLVRLLVKEARLPVIAAGGIMNGADIAGALALGASAAQLGTAFIACPESSIDAGYRAALQGPGAAQTLMIRAMSGRPARCLGNKMTQIDDTTDPALIPDYPIAYEAGKLLNVAAKAKGETGYGGQWAGSGAPRARVLPAGDLIKALVEEWSTALVDGGETLTREQADALMADLWEKAGVVCISPSGWVRIIDNPPGDLDAFVALLVHEDGGKFGTDQKRKIIEIIREHFINAGLIA
jgi:nitronate monooxygenase